jgi:hypothetical protein
MPSTFNSPFATAFKSGVKSGTPCSVIVANIAKRTNKPANAIVKSLCKAGVCFSQKFNGALVYWPTFAVTANSKSINSSQTSLWQAFVDWCILNRWCTPNRLKNNATTQANFMSFCRNFFNKQFAVVATKAKKSAKRASKGRRSFGKSRKSWSTPKTHLTRRHTKRRSTKRARKTASWRRVNATRSYKFPSYKTRTSFRRYARAA